MLTSIANQYLRPEYLTPLPTTLDAKKSPLALLAQTCSQIGADPSSTQSLLAPIEKSSHKSTSKSSEQSHEKSSPNPALIVSETIKSRFKPYESFVGREKAFSPEEQQRAASSYSSSSRVRTPGTERRRCSSNKSAASVRAVTPYGRKTATPNSDVIEESSASRSTLPEFSSCHPSADSPTIMSESLSCSPTGAQAMTDPSNNDLPLGTSKLASSIPASTSGSYLCYPPHLPIDVMAGSFMPHQHAALKDCLCNPYLGYTKMKTASGADTFFAICRDPYCTSCQLNSHLFATSMASKVSATTSSSCPAGCVQCDQKSPASPYGSFGAHNPATAGYAQAQLAALAAVSQLSYVCNWIAGDATYCGKRFSTSEELLQHVRSHTSVSGDPSIAAAALSLLSPPGLPPTHPLLSRSYSTPPLSPLAAARYHPYSKPLPLMPSSLSSLGLPLPLPHPHHPSGLPPYFSSYALYGGPRLGAASSMHL